MAVAVLLATSCSKDNDNATEVVNNGQETVQTKTFPISITVNQKGLSKLTCTGAMGEALQPTFESTDQLAIYKGETLLKSLTPSSISADGKTATFEGEIDGNGLVDGQTQLAAKIGTPLTESITATSREDAVKKGCYQTATFTYSAEGNHIGLEEQNAYIEVVWTNKGGATVEFSINSNPVSLSLNEQGQGWIVAPAGVSLTCEALGITKANTTAKANIYGITRTFTDISLNKATATIEMGATETLTATTVPSGQEVTWSSSDQSVATVEGGVVTTKKVGTTTITATFGELTATCEVTVIVPAGYVDLGVVLDDEKTKVYFSSTVTSTGVTWSANQEYWPTKAEFVNLVSDCYWVWDGTENHKGYYVFKVHDPNDAGEIINTSETHNPTTAYSTANDPYIFLPVSDDDAGGYWSSESGDDGAFCLIFGEYNVYPNVDLPTDNASSGVVTVRRSN